MLKFLNSTVRMNLLSVRLRRRRVLASFAVTPQTAKVAAPVHDKCLDKVEKAFNLWVGDMTSSWLYDRPSELLPGQ